MKITLCLLTKNELIGCMNDVPNIQKEYFDDIYAIDGDSKDGTIEFLVSMGIPVFQQPEPGLDAACVFAFEKCKTDALIFFHPKGTVPVKDILKFKPYFERGYDLIIASRNIKGAINDENSKAIKPRKWFVHFLAISASLLFRKKGNMVWDVLHGFRGMTVEGFKKITPSIIGSTIDLQMVCRSYKYNLRRIEFPTIETSRLAGETHFKAIPTGLELLNYLLLEKFSN